MSSSISFVKTQYAFLSIFPRLIIFGILCLAFYQVDKRVFFIYAIFTYFFLYIALNYLIPLDHRVGIKLIKQGRLQEAIIHFQKSADFFTKYEWIDKYRWKKR